MARRPARTDAYHHGDLKAALVAAGRSLLEREGMAGLSLRAAARAAGVSQAAPYHHFADKDALLAAIAMEGFRDLSAEMAAAAKGAATPGDHMEGLGAGYVLFAFRNPELFRLMQGPYFEATERYGDLVAVAAESYAMLQDGVRACMPDRPARDVDLACKAAWSLVHGASMLIVDKRIDVGTTPQAIDRFARAIARQLMIGGF